MTNLDSKELIKRFHGFFDEHMRREIRQAIHKEDDVLPIDFFEISQYDHALGEELLERPIDVLEIINLTLKQFADDAESKSPIARLTTLPSTEYKLIRDIRSEDIGKLVLVEGIVIRKTDVRPQLTHLEYLCTNPDCTYSTERLRLPQTEEKMTTLKACPRCKAPIDIVKKIRVDSQGLLLGENPNHLDNSGDQPKRMNVLLQDDLVSPFKENRSNPGTEVYVIGLVKDINKQTRAGSDSVNFDLIIEGHYIDRSSSDLSEINLDKEDIDKIKELAANPDVYDMLTDNFAKAIYGNTRIKEALILQLFGGAPKIKGDGTKIRGDMHMLLIGDPGAAKSQMLKASTRIAPRSTFVSGKSATGAGLIAAVVKDELTGGWALEAGAMVLASGGLCCIDEMDKMSEEDTSSMHEALEQQTVSIAKANIRATLKCETTVLAAANPKHGRFDPYGDIGKQINFPPALISRFDLIFVLRDIPDKKLDGMIAEHILATNMDLSATIAELTPEFFKKYLAYAKATSSPVLTRPAIDLIKEFYVRIRSSGADEEGEAIKAVPMTARQLEAIVRMSEAYAKVKLKKLVEAEDAQKAIDMLMYCLERLGVMDKDGKMDIDKLTTGVTAGVRNQLKNILDIMDKLETELPEVKMDDICDMAEEKLKMTRRDVIKVVENLKKEGAIFEPRKNIYKTL
ncbi:MAG: minichromosome maintenance protein MCM [Nanoarchaeales archaeon]|nr:minichromosome maintenance protein MCM [Nanoarchaeales archaeon]